MDAASSSEPSMDHSKSSTHLDDNTQVKHTPTENVVRKEFITGVEMEVSVRLGGVCSDRVLCIDGGGVKGVVEAIILRYIHFCLQQHHLGEGDKTIDRLKTLIRHDMALVEKTGTISGIDETDDSVSTNGDSSNDKTKLLESADEELDGYNAKAEPQLHRMFDIVAGTSTGSIISTAISRLHWNPEQLINTSKEIAPLIFPKPSTWNLFGKMKQKVLSVFSLLFKGLNRYSVHPLKDYLHKIIGEIPWDNTEENSKSRQSPILGILTIRNDNAQVKTFNSHEYKDTKTVTIEDAILASTAAPTYFPYHNIVDDKSTENKDKVNVEEMVSRSYVDGGLSANCPANYVMGLLKEPHFELGCLLSIGCGDDSLTYLPLERVVQMTMNNEESWNSFYKSHPKEKPFLYRITPSRKSGIGGFDLADSSKVNAMEKSFINNLLTEDDDTNGLNEMIRATNCVFAKSLSIVKAELKMDYTTKTYGYQLTMETRYNGERFHCSGVIVEEKTTNLKFKKIDDELIIPITGTYYNESSMFDFKYCDHEICGSPLFVWHKLIKPDGTAWFESN